MYRNLLPDESPLDSLRSLNYADARDLQNESSVPSKLVCPWCGTEHSNTTTDIVDCGCGAMAHILIGGEAVWVKLNETSREENEVENDF